MEEKRKNKKPNLLHCLPTELWELGILAILPPNILLRLRCVCKAWRSLIDSKRFIQEHSMIYNDKKRFERTFVWSRFFNKVILRSRNMETNQVYEISFPSKEIYYERPLVDHVNGIFLLKDFDGKLLLWNPSIRKTTYLPQCHSNPVGEKKQKEFNQPYRRWSHGLGYDNSTNDYKVVSVAILDSKHSYDHHRRHLFVELDAEVPFAVEVYSLHSHQWRIFNQQIPGLIEFSRSWVFVEGAINWIAKCYDKPPFWDLIYWIVSFDMRTEVLSYFALPERVKHCYNSVTLVKVGESLALLSFHSKSCRLWVMEEYGIPQSWTLRSKVYMEILHMLRFTTNCDMIFEDCEGEMKSCNMMNGHINVIVGDALAKLYHYGEQPYVESLVLGTALCTME